jgi:hypothetical protein
MNSWLYQIPVDVLNYIFEYCDDGAILMASFVSHSLRRILSKQNNKLNLCNYSALYNNQDIIKWALKIGFRFTNETSNIAIENCNLVTLKWLYRANCLFEQSACNIAATRGDLETLRWLKEKNVNIDFCGRSIIAAAGVDD